MSKQDIVNFRNRITTLETNWSAKLKEAYKNYATMELENKSALYNNSKKTLENIRAELEGIDASLTGIDVGDTNLIEIYDNKIKNLKNGEKTLRELENEKSLYKGSMPRHLDKYNENSLGYINLSFYTISLVSMSFFIYKQLKTD
jgi:hypothetical protein